jgi:hypothetical protein
MPQMGYDTKTDRLTDCQSQCDSDSERFSQFSQPGTFLMHVKFVHFMSHIPHSSSAKISPNV